MMTDNMIENVTAVRFATVPGMVALTAAAFRTRWHLCRRAGREPLCCPSSHFLPRRTVDRRCRPRLGEAEWRAPLSALC
jgi:hypothetical protein